MAKSRSNWHEITPSRFPWEREALDFVRGQFPGHEPYRAWTNFEFIAHDGTVNEIDLLAVTPMGFFLVEIKSRPGAITGDTSHWTWKGSDGRLVTDDNPLLLAERKAKRLAGLLRAQKAFKKTRCPFVEAIVFCSAPDQSLHLTGTASSRVFLRDRPQSEDLPARDGIMAALINRRGAGLKQGVPGVSRPEGRAIARALDQAGIRPSQRARRVADYQLKQVIQEGPNNTYQDWEAEHTTQKVSRRIRIYTVARACSEEERDLIRKAAEREYRILERLHHEAILAAEYFTQHDLGPAIVFRDPPDSMRLDHYLAERHEKVGLDTRLHLLRQLAEVVKFAHGKGVIHRALCPQSVLVTDCDAPRPSIQVLNWQTGRELRRSTTGAGGTATLHPDQLVEDLSLLYMAPEALTDPGAPGEHVDVFSLGAVAFHLFAGRPPASSLYELTEVLDANGGLDIAAALDGAGPQLVDMIRTATCPDVSMRCETVEEFLLYLEEVEDELTTPEEDVVTNPLDAGKGDRLPGGYTVVRRLGKGGSALVLLVERDGKESVLKLANCPEHNDRIKDEYALLGKLRHQYVAEVHESLMAGGLAGFTMQRAGEMTLARRLSEDGRLGLELLQRFGEDLLDVLNFMEREGFFHRDIKPDNLGVGAVTKGGPLHLILFDFSLANTSLDSVNAGTPPYLDPFVKKRKPPRWDLYAERFAAAMTLYEMTTGTHPVWGDGRSDPAFTEGEASLHPELFEASMRERMTEFFSKAFARDFKERHDNAEQMLWAWRQIFKDVGKPAATTHHDEFDLDAAVAAATEATPLLDFNLSTRALNALDRIGVFNVGELLRVPLRRVYRLRGVGSKTRKEIGAIVARLHERFPGVQIGDLPDPDQAPPSPEFASVDMLAREAGSVGSGTAGSTQEMLQAFLGIAPHEDLSYWPTQTDVAQAFGWNQSRFWQALKDARERWRRMPSVTQLRLDIRTILDRVGGVISAADLAAAVLAARGSVNEDPVRGRLAAAVVRVAVEAERGNLDRAFDDRRNGDKVVIFTQPELADYALRLGRTADRLAARDPLAAPARAAEDLRAVGLPEGREPIPQDRDLLRLAVYTSDNAALSSRMEVYPREMPAVRALRLAQGALSIARELSVKEVHQRVSGRYPEAEKLPDRPELDSLLEEVGLDLAWEQSAAGGRGAYRFRHADWLTLTSSGSSSAALTGQGGPAALVSPEEVDARLFERKLRRAEQDGAFLVLSCRPKKMQQALQALQARFDIEYRNLDSVTISAIRKVAESVGADWHVVLNADAASRDSRDWQNLVRLVGRALPNVEQQLADSPKTILLAWPGLLARYDQLSLLERLRDSIGTRSVKLPGLWLLIPGNGQARPTVAGKPVPLLDSGQYTKIPSQWIAEHAAEGISAH